MNELEIRLQAINSLLPYGTWSMNNDTGEITLSPEGVELGLVVPLDGDIAMTISNIVTNAPIVEELMILDEFVTRSKEDKAEELEIALEGVDKVIVDKKIALRSQLV